MNVLLSYPRSGQNLTKHMVEACGMRIYGQHRIRFVYHDGLPCTAVHPSPIVAETLIVLVRDYKECIIRQIYPAEEKITNTMIDSVMARKHNTTYDVDLYFENIRTYDRFTNPKVLVYYEDIVLYGQEAFMPIAKLLKLDTSTLDWNLEFEISRQSYQPAPLSDGTPKFHQYKIEDVDYYTKQITSVAPDITEKYLKRYET